MADMADLSTAVAALADPSTTAADLSVIAQTHPSLRTTVALHPNAYPGLLDWLDGTGDPAVSAAVATRRAASASMSAPPPPTYSLVSVTEVGQPSQQVPASVIEPDDVPKRNKLLFVASILVIIPGALATADGVIGIFSNHLYYWYFSLSLTIYGLYAIFTGILGLRHAANRDKAGLLVKLGIGLLVLLVLLVITSYVFRS